MTKYWTLIEGRVKGKKRRVIVIEKRKLDPIERLLKKAGLQPVKLKTIQKNGKWHELRK